MNASAARVPSLHEAAGPVEALVAQLRAERESFVVVPVEAVAPERALSVDAEAITAFFAAEGDAYVGLGVAFRARPGRAPGLAHLRDTLAPKLATLGEPEGTTTLAPFALGALPFDRARDEDFFGLHGELVVPRVAYVVRRGRGFVTAVGSLAEVDEIRALATALCARLAEPVRHVRVRATRVADGSGAAYVGAVARALDAIREGALAKVVLARRAELSLDRPLDLASLVSVLGARAEGTHRFVLARRGVAFLGATPERLVSCRAGAIATEALAGTKRRGESSALVASTKDRAEQRWVIDAIRDALAPLVESVETSAEPRARELRDVVHLSTAIGGALREGHDVFDVVDALHPTPAVGGVPREAALAHVAAAEGFSRGLYAAPFGVVDARGDAELVVALRSGVFHGSTAHLFAGAGIVAGSVPELELDETELKLRALLGALDDEAL